MKYKISRYAALHGVTYRTVWNWIRDDKIKYEVDSTGHKWVIDDAVSVEREKTYAVYARISDSEDKENLNIQTERLVSFCNARGYKVRKIVKEIGSGLNDQRPKLEKLLLDKEIDVIVVENKYRLARFGLNYIQKLLELQGRKVEIVNDVMDPKKTDIVQEINDVLYLLLSNFCEKQKLKKIVKNLIRELNVLI